MCKKGKFHPKTSHEGPDLEQRYTFTLFPPSALDGGGGQRQTPVALPSGKTPADHCAGGS